MTRCSVQFSDDVINCKRKCYIWILLYRYSYTDIPNFSLPIVPYLSYPKHERKQPAHQNPFSDGGKAAKTQSLPGNALSDDPDHLRERSCQNRAIQRKARIRSAVIEFKAKQNTRSIPSLRRAGRKQRHFGTQFTGSTPHRRRAGRHNKWFEQTPIDRIRVRGGQAVITRCDRPTYFQESNNAHEETRGDGEHDEQDRKNPD